MVTPQEVVATSREEAVVLGHALQVGRTKPPQHQIEIVVYSSEQLNSEKWILGRAQYKLAPGQDLPYIPFDFNVIPEERQDDWIENDIRRIVIKPFKLKPFYLYALSHKGDSNLNATRIDEENGWAIEMITRMQEAARFKLNDLEMLSDAQLCLMALIRKLEGILKFVRIENERRAVHPLLS